jgi:hypothetical protein
MQYGWTARIASLAWPILIGQLATIMNGVIDTIMTARYSAMDLAALGLGSSVYISIFVGLFSILLTSMLHYRCWKVLPVHFRATTPGKAIGYCFIPLYNFYWAFMTFPKLVDGLFSWQKSEGKAASLNLRGLACAYSVLSCILSFELLYAMFSDGKTFNPVIEIILEISGIVLFIQFYRQVVVDLNAMRQQP